MSDAGSDVSSAWCRSCTRCRTIIATTAPVHPQTKLNRGPVSSPGAGETVESADCCIFLGARFNDYNTTGYTCLIKKKGMIKANPDRVETPKGEFGCVFLPDFAEALAVRWWMDGSSRGEAGRLGPRAWMACLEPTQRHRNSQAEVKPNDASLKAYTRIYAAEAPPPEHPPATPLSMRFVKHRVESLLSGTTDLILETGDSWFQGQTMKLPKGCGYEFQMQYGSIGWSVGAVLGYAVAVKPKGRRVIAMIGDGSFQMTAQEVSTMIRYDQNPIIFLINNKVREAFWMNFGGARPVFSRRHMHTRTSTGVHDRGGDP